jgi:ComF family protein
VDLKPYFPTTRDLTESFPQRILDSLLNLIYPDICFICSAPLARRRDCGICSNCWKKTIGLKIAKPWCTSCGLPFQGKEEHLCGKCILHPPPYAGARSYGYYTEELSGLVQGLKFHGRRNLSRLAGPLLADAFYDSWGRDEFDLAVSIPLHPKRKRERGFNQAELLARSLVQLIKLPFCKNALVRIRQTLPQVGLTDSERLENMHKAFRCNNLITKKRVLLIDDVMTTGATVASATQALLEGGALRVSVLTLARAVPWF